MWNEKNGLNNKCTFQFPIHKLGANVMFWCVWFSPEIALLIFSFDFFFEWYKNYFLLFILSFFFKLKTHLNRVFMSLNWIWIFNRISYCLIRLSRQKKMRYYNKKKSLIWLQHKPIRTFSFPFVLYFCSCLSSL